MSRFPLAFLRALLFPGVLLALLLGPTGCASTAGMTCSRNGDCDDGQVCAPQVDGCSDPGGCFSICGRPCDDDDDCSGGAFCEQSADIEIAICRDTPDPG